jgi:hypothetical protein
MDLAIPLDKMTTIEKLRAIEEIWDDLRRTAEHIPSPAWHADVLFSDIDSLQIYAGIHDVHAGRPTSQ